MTADLRVRGVRCWCVCGCGCGCGHLGPRSELVVVAEPHTQRRLTIAADWHAYTLSGAGSRMAHREEARYTPAPTRRVLRDLHVLPARQESWRRQLLLEKFHNGSGHETGRLEDGLIRDVSE